MKVMLADGWMGISAWLLMSCAERCLSVLLSKLDALSRIAASSHFQRSNKCKDQLLIAADVALI